MKFNIIKKEISGPFTIPSGIIDTEVSVLEKIANEIPEIGILTTKSISLEPEEGNKGPIIAQYSPFSLINAVGGTNPGAEEFAKRLSKIKIPKDKFLLISIFGRDAQEFKKVSQILYNFADGFELNISCPHSDKYGQVVGKDRELVKKLTRSVSSLGKPVFVKLSPNLQIKETLKAVIEGGASGITAINTKGPESYLHDGFPVLSNKVGGISGRAILELGLKCVKEIREITDLPIIACAGISRGQDIRNYRKAGADFFGVGTALSGMNTEEIKQYFRQLLIDSEKGTDEAVNFLKEELNMEYQKCRVQENRPIAEDLFLLRLDKDIKVEPGQFIFCWLPEKEEKPFSVFDDNPLTLLIKKKGCFTKELARLNKGETVYLRGPYGNSPKIGRKTLIVGGGTGIAALYLFCKRNPGTIALLGAKDKEHLVYLKEFNKVCERVYLTTETGETGYKGLVTDMIEQVTKKEEPVSCLNCGPEGMVRKAIEKERKHIPLERIYSSIEFLTKCGIGQCGSCATKKGYRSCVDGTFLKYNQI